MSRIYYYIGDIFFRDLILALGLVFRESYVLGLHCVEVLSRRRPSKFQRVLSFGCEASRSFTDNK